MISLICPTRRRPDNVRRLIDAATATAAGPIEFVFYVDTDDPTFPYDELAAQMVVVRGPRIVLSEMWNRAAKVATGDVLMHCGDDLTFDTPGWDDAVYEAFAAWPDRLVLVHGNDLSPWAYKIATHSFVSREWYDLFGRLVPPWFSSDYNDTWLTDVADACGRRVYLSHVITEHHHPAFDKAEWDETHRERMERHHADDVAGLYERLADVRAEDVARLRAAIEEAARCASVG